MAGIDYGNILNSGDTTNDGYILPCRTYIELTLHPLHNVPKNNRGEDYIAPLEATLVHLV